MPFFNDKFENPDDLFLFQIVNITFGVNSGLSHVICFGELSVQLIVMTRFCSVSWSYGQYSLVCVCLYIAVHPCACVCEYVKLYISLVSSAVFLEISQWISLGNQFSKIRLKKP